MSSTDDKNVAAGPGKSLVISGLDEAPSATRPSSALRWIVPSVLIALTGGIGWYAGAQAGLPASEVNQNSQVSQISQAMPVSQNAAMAETINAQAATIAALEARLQKLESAPGVEASIKPAIEILAQRIDEIARRQTGALTQTSNRLDRTDRDFGSRLDRMSERIERMEKQVSSETPVGSTEKNVTAVPRAEPPAEKTKPEASKARQLRGYVLRDVFRGGAVIESRYGLMEVTPGVQLPGAGRVRSVEQRDGRWVVVTTAGVIESR
jgi:hypothetical protein